MTVSRLKLVLGCVCALLARGSPFRASADMVGVPWTGQPGITKTVENIMAEERQMAVWQTGRVRNKPVLRPDRRGLPQDPQATDATTVARGMKVQDSGPFTPRPSGRASRERHLRT